jgi:hypothetical protein
MHKCVCENREEMAKRPSLIRTHTVHVLHIICMYYTSVTVVQSI